MAKYIKKPVIIEAVQFTRNNFKEIEVESQQKEKEEESQK